MTTERHKNIVASYLLLIRDGKILLSRRTGTGYEDGKYGMVAGHVEQGESCTQCMIREAREEVGIELQSEDLQVVHVMHRNEPQKIDDERMDVFFTVTKWQGTIENKEPEKCDDLAWFDLGQLPANTIVYILQAISLAQKKVLYSEHGWIQT